MKDSKKAEEIAAKRVQMVSPLLAEGLDAGQIRTLKTEICARTGISERTLRRYLARYRTQGFGGLKPGHQLFALISNGRKWTKLPVQSLLVTMSVSCKKPHVRKFAALRSSLPDAGGHGIAKQIIKWFENYPNGFTVKSVVMRKELSRE